MEEKLVEKVWSEVALMEFLGVSKQTLDYLRTDKGLPAVQLTRRERVYFADKVLAWLKQRPQTG